MAFGFEVREGDEVLYHREMHEPVVRRKVTRVTAKGWIKIEHSLYHYVPASCHGVNGVIACATPRERHAYGRIYPLTAESDVNDIVSRENERRDRKRLEREELARRLEERNAEELAEVRKVMGGDTGLIFRTRHRQTLPDGKRLYVIEVPVPESLAESKKYETLIVTCANTERTDFNDETGRLELVERIELAFAGVTGRNSSFSTNSPTFHKTDKDALWHAIRSAYFSPY